MPTLYGKGTLGFALHAPHHGLPGWDLLYARTDCLSKHCAEIRLPTSMNSARNFSHFVVRKSGAGAVYFLSIAGFSACKDARPFETFSCPSTRSSTFYTLREIERQEYGHRHR
jgi:hypothetical protein